MRKRDKKHMTINKEEKSIFSITLCDGEDIKTKLVVDASPNFEGLYDIKKVFEHNGEQTKTFINLVDGKDNAIAFCKEFAELLKKY